MRKAFFALVLAVLANYMAFAANVTDKAKQDFEWFNGNCPVTYAISGKASPVVAVASAMFSDDLRQVTGLLPERCAVADAKIVVVQLDKNRGKANSLRKAGVPIDSIKDRKDAFAITLTGSGDKRQLTIVGSNGRGAAYGLLELSRMAGVSPWIWWGDVTPLPRKRLAVDAAFSMVQSPSVEYRGIFLNDEDWSFLPWSWRTFEPNGKMGTIGANTYREVFKLLLRLRANLIWPAMHEHTVPFYLVPGAKEAADSCGIVIGTSHCEPLMRNNVGEWNVAERGAYNYITNGERVRGYWSERLSEVGKLENIYTIGMRGIHDGAMEGVKTLQEKTDALQRVIDDQRALLRKYVGKDLTAIPQAFVPYKEVLEIMDNGLRVPDDVTLIWCDDNYGYMTRLGDSALRQRKGGAGVYYHLSYWGRPHDHLWLCTTQPGLIYNEMRTAYDLNARRLWVANVHDPKTASYGMELFLDMAWDINSVSHDTLERHLYNRLKRDFGKSAADILLPAMKEFYRLCGIRKPEFMGWTQVELDKRKYYRGWSPVVNTEFSQKEFGNELQRYLDDYARLCLLVDSAEGKVADSRKDAFFAHVRYPLCSAAAMSVKMLEAQKARMLYPGITDERLYTRHDSLLASCARSMAAYNTIRKLTNHYNNTMSDGKWRQSMSLNPRDLPVFFPPTLPLWVDDADVDSLAALPCNPALPLDDIRDSTFIASNASYYLSATPGTHVVQMLGHSMAALALPRNATVTYRFNTESEGKAVLRMALIPTQPNDSGNIRFSVSIDGAEPIVCSLKEKYRSETWKLNVLRGQALKTFDISLSKGTHTMTVTAIDDHIVLDQWMIDFNPAREFYVFPTARFSQP